MSSLKKAIRHIISKCVCAIDVMLVRSHLIKPRIIIYMDGGLCSQMNMWAQGQYYAEKGYDVYYDLDWFRRSGKGIDGISVRNFELKVLWPNYQVRTMSRWRTTFYKQLLPWHEVSCSLPEVKYLNRSVYFKGYNRLPEEEKVRLFRQYFALGTALITEKMKLEKGKRYCGVHVRRGDLANVTIAGHYPQMTDGYFIRAIEYVQQHERIDEYLLFSEDAQWLRENIVPNVSVPCHIMEGNTGYEDLMLLAQCSIIIASQGSFGTTAALMNPNCELLIRNVQISDIPYAHKEKQVI